MNNFKKDNFWKGKKKRIYPGYILLFIAVAAIILLILLIDGRSSRSLTGKVIDETPIEYDEEYYGYKNPVEIDGITYTFKNMDKEYSLVQRIREAKNVYEADGIFFIAWFEITNNNDKPVNIDKPAMWIVTDDSRFATRQDAEEATLLGLDQWQELAPGETIEKARIFDVSPEVTDHMIMMEHGNKRYYLETR